MKKTNINMLITEYIQSIKGRKIISSEHDGVPRLFFGLSTILLSPSPIFLFFPRIIALG